MSGPLPPVTGNGDHATVRLIDYLEAIRDGDIALQTERDRRYAELNIEKEKALKIKETADLAALQLAREIQTYKDEKANELREQINSERGLYVTKAELTGSVREIRALVEPLTKFVAEQQGKTGQAIDQRLSINTIVSVVAVIMTAVFLYLALKPH